MLFDDVTTFVYSYDSQSKKINSYDSQSHATKLPRGHTILLYDIRGKPYDKYDPSYAVPRR